MGIFSSRIPSQSIIVVDMDNTLVDEFGATERPGVKDLLQVLKKNYSLVLWTNSTRDRARTILGEHLFNPYFTKFIFREDYDPENRGISKDCRKIKAAFIIDDDPGEISFNQKNRVRGFQITSYRKNMSGYDFAAEYREIIKLITGG